MYTKALKGTSEIEYVMKKAAGAYEMWTKSLNIYNITRSKRSLEECVRYVCKAYRLQLTTEGGWLLR